MRPWSFGVFLVYILTFDISVLYLLQPGCDLVDTQLKAALVLRSASPYANILITKLYTFGCLFLLFPLHPAVHATTLERMRRAKPPQQITSRGAVT
jgi:hypothetical protein